MRGKPAIFEGWSEDCQNGYFDYRTEDGRKKWLYADAVHGRVTRADLPPWCADDLA